MVPIADGVRHLGVQCSLLLDPHISMGAISDIVDDTMGRIAAVHVGGNETRFIAEQVTWANARCRLWFDLFVPGGGASDDCRAIYLRSLLLHRENIAQL